MTTVFALRALAPRAEYYARLVRWFFAACAAVVMLTIIWSIAVYVAHPQNPQDLGIVALTGVIAFVMALMVRMSGPGAVSVAVSGEHVRFTYPSGRTQDWVWSDPDFHHLIDVTPGASDSGSDGRPSQAAQGDRAFQNFLTPEATGAILEMARKKSMVLTEGPSPRQGWTRIRISH